MLYIKEFYTFINESIDLNIKIDDIIKIFDEQVDIFKKLNIDKDQIDYTGNIEELYNNNDFSKKLNDKNYKKGKFEDTSYDETLLGNTILKFFFIYDKTDNELQEPRSIVLQYIENNKKSNILCYKGNINKIFQKLTDKTIELTDGTKTYLYKTTNAGNNWIMNNVQMETNKMKTEIDKEELNDLISKKNIKIK